jgi:hypothetical protein
MTESNLVDAYLALTRQALTPSLALRDRVQSRLDAAVPLGESGAPGAAEGAALGAGALTSGVGSALLGAGLRVPGGAAPGAMLTPVAAASQGARGNIAALLGGGLLVLGFLSGYWARGIDGQPPPLRPALAAVQEEQLNEELVPEAPARPQLHPGQRPSAAHSASSRNSNTPRHGAAATRAPAITPSATRDELLLLQRTERAVRANNSALALMLLGELEAQYPRSELLEERRALELLAHCVAHASDSVPRAERFLREHPRSVYAERIGALCQVEAPATPR